MVFQKLRKNGRCERGASGVQLWPLWKSVPTGITTRHEESVKYIYSTLSHCLPIPHASNPFWPNPQTEARMQGSLCDAIDSDQPPVL